MLFLADIVSKFNFYGLAETIRSIALPKKCYDCFTLIFLTFLQNNEFNKARLNRIVLFKTILSNI